MPTQTRRRGGARRSGPAGRPALRGLDPLRLKQLLDTHFDDNGEGVNASPYRALYVKAHRAALAEYSTSACRRVEELLGHIDDWAPLHDAIRAGGFVQGFEVARQLLLGEIDLEVLKQVPR